MRIDVPERTFAAGFSNEPIGTHTGKTMMLSELRLLLEAVPGAATSDEYRRAAVVDNALSKSTAANRSNTLMYLRQLYGLRPDIPVFAALRELWPASPAAQPVMAFVCAATRDTLLRSTTNLVLGTDAGGHVAGKMLSDEIAAAFPGRYSPKSLHNLGQNIASSWTQAGFLTGTRDKRRSHPVVEVPAVVYALYLGHLEGFAGPALFGTMWTRLLGIQEPALRAMVETGARSGWLEYRSSGGMTEITFRHLDELTSWRGV